MYYIGRLDKISLTKDTRRPGAGNEIITSRGEDNMPYVCMGEKCDQHDRTINNIEHDGNMCIVSNAWSVCDICKQQVACLWLRWVCVFRRRYRHITLPCMQCTPTLCKAMYASLHGVLHTFYAHERSEHDLLYGNKSPTFFRYITSLMLDLISQYVASGKLLVSFPKTHAPWVTRAWMFSSNFATWIMNYKASKSQLLVLYWEIRRNRPSTS